MNVVRNVLVAQWGKRAFEEVLNILEPLVFSISDLILLFGIVESA